MTSEYICLCLKIGVSLQKGLWILGQGVEEGGPLGTWRVEKASQLRRLPRHYICLSPYDLLNKNVVPKWASKWGERKGRGVSQGQGRVSLASISGLL